MARQIRMEYAGAIKGGPFSPMTGIACRGWKPWARRVRRPGGGFMPACSWAINYHLLVETPEANLVAGTKWLQGT